MPYNIIKDDEIVQKADYFVIRDGGVLELQDKAPIQFNPYAVRIVGVYAPGTWDYVFPTEEVQHGN